MVRKNSAGATAPILGWILAILGCAALSGCQTTASSPELDATDPTPPKRR